MEKVLTIKVECGNAAFDEHLGVELARILRREADKLEVVWEVTRDAPPYQHDLRDTNGHKVGTICLAEGED